MPEFNVPVIYDALAGRLRRQLHPTDIVNLATAGTIGAVGSTVAFVVITSSFDFYVTGMSAQHVTDVRREVHIMGGGGAGTGTSTLFSVILGPAQGIAGSITTSAISLITTREAPILKVSGPSTVSIGALAGTTGSFAASIWGVREPVIGEIETF